MAWLRRRLSLVLCVVAAGAVPSVASASIQLGPDLDVPPPGGLQFAGAGCQQGLTGRCSFFNDASVASPTWTVAAPSDGIITSWRFRGGCCLEDNQREHRVVLRTFRQGDRPDYEYVKAAVGTGAAYVLPPGGVLSSNDVVEVPDRLPIAKGQWPGINVDWPLMLAGKAAAGNRFRFMQPAPPDAPPGVSTVGTVYEASASGYDGAVLSFNATFEPDADHDGYGDDSQDCAPADPTIQSGCTPPAPPVVLPPPPNPPSVGINCSPSCPSSGSGGGAGTSGQSGGTGTQTYVVFGNLPSGPTASRSGYVVPVACPPGSSVNCTGTVDITLNGGRAAAAATKTKAYLLGRQAFSVAPGATKTIRLTFSKAARKRLARIRRPVVTVTLRPVGGTPISVRRTLPTLKRR